MSSHAYKMHDVDKNFGGYTEVYVLQKMIFEPYQ